jgi:hypothetical protein
MSKNSDAEKTRWDQVMENFDLLFQSMNDIGLIQQEMKRDLNTAKEEQKKIVQQVQANGQAVANLTLKQMERETLSDHSDGAQCYTTRKKWTSRMSLQKGKRPSWLGHPGNPDNTVNNPGKNLYLTMLYPKSIFQNSMGLAPRFGLTIASTISPSTPYLMS